MAPRLRDLKDGKDFDEDNYGDSNLFTIRMYHGGRMHERYYEGGKVDHWDFCEKDQMSLALLDWMCKQLKHDGIIMYWWKLTIEPMEGSLRLLKENTDIVEMITGMAVHTRVIEVYLEHIRSLDGNKPKNSPVFVENGLDTMMAVWGLEKMVKYGFIVEQQEVADKAAVVIEELPNEEEQIPLGFEDIVDNIEDVVADFYIGGEDMEVGGDEQNVDENVEVVVEGPGRGKRVRVPMEANGVDLYELLGIDDDDDELEDGDYHPDADFDDSDYSGDEDEITATSPGFDDIFGYEEFMDACEQEGGVGAGGDQEGEHVGPTRYQEGAHVQPSGDNIEEDRPAFLLEETPYQAAFVDVNQTEEVISAATLEDNIEDEELRSWHSSEDEDHEEEITFNPLTDMKNPVIKKGMLFEDCYIFRTALREIAIRSGVELDWHRNERFKISVRCKGKNCPWEIYVGRKCSGDPTLKVKRLIEPHNCTRIWKNREASYEWLAAKIINDVQSNPQIPINSIVDKASLELNVGVSTMKAYRAKKVALEKIQGNLKKQYDRLRDYCDELRRTNPGTTTKIHCQMINDLPQFKRLYICLAACKEGFKSGCRKLVGIDGCHLKGVYGGQLLTAVGVDANNETWVIAYAAVEIESTDSWTWFLELLAQDIAIENQNDWCFISDKQKGILGAFKDVLPNVELRFCSRHLYTNFRRKFKGLALKNQLWAIVGSTTRQWYEKQMGIMLVLHKPAFDFLRKFPKGWYTKAYYSTATKCDMTMNNICESFNKSILSARDKPIITMMEMIRVLLMNRIRIRRNKIMKWPHKVCPKPFKKIESRKILACELTVEWNGDSKYQVKKTGEQFVVDLALFVCECRKWSLGGIPCKHAIAAMNFMGALDPHDFVDKSLLTATYKEIYNNVVMPINGESMWSTSEHLPIQPPAYTRQPGRPKKVRIRDPHEKEDDNSNARKISKSGGTVTCSHCHETGHNSSTCHRHLPPRPKPASRPRGRPRKNPDVRFGPSVPNTETAPVRGGIARGRGSRGGGRRGGTQQSTNGSQARSTTATSGSQQSTHSGSSRGGINGTRGGRGGRRGMSN